MCTFSICGQLHLFNILLSVVMSFLSPIFAEIEFVQLLFRHGDRSAIHNFPANPHRESDWPQGYGQLSKLGIEQHYQLGHQFRARYNKLLGPYFINKDIYIRSTDVDRTLMSAYSNLAGLFPPNDSMALRPNMKWQPIPVHTIPEMLDPVLDAHDVHCDRYSQLYKEAMHSVQVQNFIKTNWEFMNFIAKKTGIPPDIKKVSDVYDALFCQSQHQMSQPDWLDSLIMDRLYQFSVEKYEIAYAKFEMKKIRAGVLINNITNYFMMKSQGLLENAKRKMIMYSAHDTTLVSLLSGLDLWDHQVPPYASCVMMELHKDIGTERYYVQIHYQKGPKSEPNLLTLPGCESSCPLNQFAELVKNIRMTEDEFHSMCSSNLLTDEGVVWICAGLVLLVITVTCGLRRKRRLKNSFVLPSKIV